MVKAHDFEILGQRLRGILKTAAPLGAPELCLRLGISQASFSRLLKGFHEDLLILGKGQNTRYALVRPVPHVKQPVPVYEINEKGEPRHLAHLHALEDKGYFFESRVPDLENQLFADWPFFLEDIRPAGFLGRLIPRRYPELQAPDDIRNWNNDHVLNYLTRYGWDTIGNLVLGDEAYKLRGKNLENLTLLVPASRRGKMYPVLAEEVLSTGLAGSSAAGEQPKFLAWREDKSKTPVLVKFSPRLESRASRRWADLLFCEHLAHRVLAKHGQISLESKMIRGGQRVFLEGERFDRAGIAGRRGVISLLALSLEHTGTLGTWSQMGQSLFNKGIIDFEVCQRIRWQDLFGALIANTDRHGANLSFFIKNLKPVAMAPVYDMLPMLYRPEHEELIDRTFDPPAPLPSEMVLWKGAFAAARDFWQAVIQSSVISRDFKSIAGSNLKKILALG